MSSMDLHSAAYRVQQLGGYNSAAQCHKLQAKDPSAARLAQAGVGNATEHTVQHKRPGFSQSTTIPIRSLEPEGQRPRHLVPLRCDEIPACARAASTLRTLGSYEEHEFSPWSTSSKYDAAATSDSFTLISSLVTRPPMTASPETKVA